MKLDRDVTLAYIFDFAKVLTEAWVDSCYNFRLGDSVGRMFWHCVLAQKKDVASEFVELNRKAFFLLSTIPVARAENVFHSNGLQDA